MLCAPSGGHNFAAKVIQNGGYAGRKLVTPDKQRRQFGLSPKICPSLVSLVCCSALFDVHSAAKLPAYR